jgi:hypothetical protein
MNTAAEAAVLKYIAATGKPVTCFNVAGAVEALTDIGGRITADKVKLVAEMYANAARWAA